MNSINMAILEINYRFKVIPSKCTQNYHRPSKNNTQFHREKTKYTGYLKQSCTIKELLEVSLSLISNSTIDLEY